MEDDLRFFATELNRVWNIDNIMSDLTIETNCRMASFDSTFFYFQFTININYPPINNDNKIKLNSFVYIVSYILNTHIETTHIFIQGRMFYSHEEFTSPSEYRLPIATAELIKTLNKRFASSSSSSLSSSSSSTSISTSSVLPKVAWNRPKSKSVSQQKELDKPVLDDATKQTQTLRIALNKLSVKNYIVQKKIIFDALSWFVEKDEIASIASLLFGIVAGNIFFNEIYCNMYADMIDVSPVFLVELDARLSAFAEQTIKDIQQVDVADYDIMCAYNTEKANRKAAAAFYGNMGNRRIVSMSRIRFVVTTLCDAAILATPMLGEEIIDLVCVFITTCNAAKDNNKNEDWIIVMDTINALKQNASLTKKSQISLLNAIDR
jgi:hypothetical protein